ncbi:unnamed protein product [Darwinula stevensoni]|uniref:Uncharacterized protein n=1 Tax=Darwinula stevensoni TaxID=69355 RepID=A0A7R9A7H9_9CRUS|nr:unnamed protein product [Darwinula stevensoni]CAG0893452.1 unnamed protein product [Darwinula stevensoni]
MQMKAWLVTNVICVATIDPIISVLECRLYVFSEFPDRAKARNSRSSSRCNPARDEILRVRFGPQTEEVDARPREIPEPFGAVTRLRMRKAGSITVFPAMRLLQSSRLPSLQQTPIDFLIKKSL